jgi:hypothetical protein
VGLVNWFIQVWAVAIMSLRTLRERRGASLATVFGVACVVAVFVAVLSIARGFEAAMTTAGSPDNAVVLTEAAVLNEGGLRFPDEFVRHKILDILGDLALLGYPVLGHFVGIHSGHELHAHLMRRLSPIPPRGVAHRRNRVPKRPEQSRRSWRRPQPTGLPGRRGPAELTSTKAAAARASASSSFS